MSKPFISILSPQGFRALLRSSSSHSRVVPIDATWYMPNSPHNGKGQYLNEDRIKDAAFFDLDEVALPESKYPHMLPPYEVFRKNIEALKLQKTDKLVFYDKTGIFSSPRAAWTFSLYGHGRVYLLNHYPDYKKHDYPLDTNPKDNLATSAEHGDAHHYELISQEQFSDNYQDQVIDYEELLALVQSEKLEKHYVTFDARSTDRFTGKSPEPRPGLSSGHIPGALSLPFNKVLKEDGSYKSKEELIQLFKDDFNIDVTDPTLGGKEAVIVMCGTGVTAVILKLALQSVIGTGFPIRVYDGSWTEWAQRAPSAYIAKSG